jgi:hypothetical protein
MTTQQHEHLLRYIAEEMAHFKFGEDAVEFDTVFEEYNFTPDVNRWINTEIENLELLFESYDCNPKLSLIQKIKNLFRNG